MCISTPCPSGVHEGILSDFRSMLVPVMKPAVGKQFWLCSPADPASLFISRGAISNTEYSSVVRTLSSGGGLKRVALAERGATFGAQRLSAGGQGQMQEGLNVI